MKYCFDLDDTISVHTNRDYENASPIWAVVERMREIRQADPEAHILIHTARGMNSCKGDAKQAEAKNRPTIERWLAKYNVPYDEIIFGKPLADFYIDDKAIHVRDLETKGVRMMKGYSGACVISVGDLVVKEGERTAYEKDWYDRSRAMDPGTWNTPRIYAYTLGKLYMEKIQGLSLTDYLNSVATTPPAQYEVMTRVRAILNKMSSQIVPGENETKAYSDYIRQRAESIGVNAETICRQIEKDQALREITFCHGDFTTSNILIGRGRYWLIDPTPSHVNSWLMDAAKFRASLRGLTAAIEGRTIYNSDLVRLFDMATGLQGNKTIHALEQSHIIRVMYYAKLRDDRQAFDRLERLLEL